MRRSAICAELEAVAFADIDGRGRTWGVWAAEAPGARAVMHQAGDGRWLLNGGKAWCSGPPR